MSGDIDIELVISLAPGYGAALRRLREAKDMTLEQAAEAAGISLASLSNWENEKSKKPNTKKVQTLLAVLSDEVRAIMKPLTSAEIEQFKTQLSDKDFVAQELARILLSGSSPWQIDEDICQLMDSRVLAATALRALKSFQDAKVYFERSDGIRRDTKRTIELKRDESISDCSAFLPVDRTIFRTGAGEN